MNRYRKGWFGESHRHYLAAKGVKTNRYYARPFAYHAEAQLPAEKMVDESQEQHEAMETPEQEMQEHEYDVMDEEREKMRTENPVRTKYGDKFFNVTNAITSMGAVTKDVGSEIAGMADWFRTVEYDAKKGKKKEFYRG